MLRWISIFGGLAAYSAKREALLNIATIEPVKHDRARLTKEVNSSIEVSATSASSAF